MKTPSYEKPMRERAKARGEYLVTVDVVRPSGRRDFCSQGPMTKRQAKLIVDAWLKAIKMRPVAPA